MKKLIMLFVLACVAFSCTPKLEVPLATDSIPLIGDAGLIQSGQAVKQETLIFNNLKQKGSRKKYIDSITMLNNQVLELYKQKKITFDKYNTYETGAQAVGVVLYFFAEFLDGSSQPANDFAAFDTKMQGSSNEFIKKYQPQIHSIMASPTPDPFIQIAEVFIKALKEEISQIQNP